MKNKEFLSRLYEYYFLEEIEPTEEYFKLNQLAENKTQELLIGFDEGKKREIMEVRNKTMEAEAEMNKINFIEGYIAGSKIILEIFNISIQKNEN